MEERPNLWTTVEERRAYMNNQYQNRKQKDPEKHQALMTRIVRYARLKKYGVIGAPEEQPADRCAFPGCIITRQDQSLHADHDHAKPNEKNFRDWLCKNHNIAVGFFERYGEQCAEYLRRFQ